ncbi:MAG: DUF4173 domain-containing protein [Gemmatimonadota bacterium]
MTQVVIPKRPLILGGLLLGVIADVLLRAPGAPGLNLALWALALGGATGLLHRRKTGAPYPEATILVAGGVLLAATIAWRDSEALKLLALAGSATAFALPAYRAGASWVRRTHVFEYGGAIAAAMASSAFGCLFLAFDGPDDSRAAPAAGVGWWRRLGPVLRGAALALPVLLVVGALFAAADPVFADFMARLVRFDLERIFEHLFVTGLFAWIATGYLRSFLGRSPLAEVGRLVSWRPSLGAGETATALALLDLLFLVFVAVQLRTFFGGAAFVEATPGLSFAEYAREGFFELVAVGAIVIPFLLAADQMMRRDSSRDERVFRALAGLQVLLLAAVMASAIQRLRLYLAEYGLTEARFFAAAFLGWLALLLVWFTATVLRGRRRPFAFGALLMGFGWIAALILTNPDAAIVRANVAREGTGVEFDAAYVTRLSADAVPTLVASLPALTPVAHCRVARSLLDRWGTPPMGDWRSWSLSAWRARVVVARERVALTAALGEMDDCPDGTT